MVNGRNPHGSTAAATATTAAAAPHPAAVAVLAFRSGARLTAVPSIPLYTADRPLTFPSEFPPDFPHEIWSPERPIRGEIARRRGTAGGAPAGGSDQAELRDRVALGRQLGHRSRRGGTG